MAASIESVIETGGKPGELPRFLSVKEGLQIAEDTARRKIAYLVVIGYLGVLAVNVLPVAVYLLSHDLRVQDVKDLATTMAVVISGVTGVVGFVLGYYFKAGERSSTIVATEVSDST